MKKLGIAAKGLRGELEMKIRPFSPIDAQFCYKIRNDALIQKFYGELKPEEVTAAANAFMQR